MRQFLEGLEHGSVPTSLRDVKCLLVILDYKPFVVEQRHYNQPNLPQLFERFGIFRRRVFAGNPLLHLVRMSSATASSTGPHPASSSNPQMKQTT